MKRFSKWWQRWMLDSLTKEQPPLVFLFVIVFGSVFVIGFLCAHWLDQIDLANYKPYYGFSDNIGGVKIDLMIDVFPVDVVYTWVNGSDPQLLNNLKELKEDIDGIACIYQNCFSSSFVAIYIVESKEIKKSFHEFPYSMYKTVEVSKGSLVRHVKLLQLNDTINYRSVKEQVYSHFGVNASVQLAFWTSEVKVGWSIEWNLAAIIRLSADSDIHVEISNILPNSYDHFFETCSFTKYKDTYIIECTEESLIQQLKEAIGYINLSQKYPKYWPAHIILQSDNVKHYPKADFDVNRFVDNEELRYSLRSLEKYAPWVRKIYIVTNGQIPYWLNLDNTRLTIITHDQIFSNLSHLPTYSSPAIESHIHRIPGLSDNFLYLNDDVMFGDTVWPEDFYSPAFGYKIYLAWSLPECSSGCPGSWINDGYCDRACNTSECNWDGGDCPGDKEFVPSDYFDKGEADILVDSDYCSTSCADNWLGDTYCDTACNTETCGYDAGDCGSEIIKENVFQIVFDPNENNTLVIPKGTISTWIDLKELLEQYQNASVKGTYTATKGVRTTIFNNALKMLIFVFKANSSGTFDLNLTFNRTNDKGQTFKVAMSVEFNTNPTTKEFLQKELNKTNSSFKIPHFNFSRILPQILKYDEQKYVNSNFNISEKIFPKEINQSLHVLNKDFKEGFLSAEGYKLKRNLIFFKYFEGSNSKLKRNSQDLPNLNINFVNTSHDIIHRKLLNYKNKLNDNENFETYLALYKGKFPWERHKDIFSYQYHKGNFKKELVTKEKFDKYKNLDLIGSLNENIASSGAFYDKIYSDERSYFMKKHKTNMGRKLLDAYSDSLLFVNRLYNFEYDFEARRVPAHMPHFINKKILEELQEKFADEFYVTSSHKLRQGNDMQFAFSYFYYLMSEKKLKSYQEIFKDFDTDLSGTWSDREIRTFLTRTNDLPLTYRMIVDLHKELKNCSQKYETQPVPTKPYERYADSDLPTVSEELVVKCANSILSSRLQRLIKVPRFSFSVMPDSVIHFKMITSNLSTVIHQLDDVRKHPKKFICLNSDLDPSGKDNDLIRALMQDTYESLYPLPSPFELPYNYRNRFSYMYEVDEWKRWRNFFRALIYASITCLAVMTILTFFKVEIEILRRRWCRRLKRNERGLGHRV